MTWFSKIIGKDTGNKQGSDGTTEYTKSRNVRFIIGQYNTGAVVSFKPFLSSFNMKFESTNLDKTKEYQGLDKKKVYKTESVYVSYDITLELLAHSVNEANMNTRRINEMGKMFYSVFDSKAVDTTKDLRNSYFVSFANIIGSQHTPGTSINDFNELLKQGVPCFIDKFDFSIDKDMGYFEYASTLLPKKYTITLNLKVSNGSYASANNGNYLWLPMLDNGVLYKQDIRRFPFGITSRFKEEGSDGSRKYAENKNAFVWIAKKYKGERGKPSSSLLKFKPFINDIKWSHSYSNGGISQMDDRGGTYQMHNDAKFQVEQKVNLSFSVISHSINEANNNMKKVQILLRILDTYYPQKDTPESSIVWSSPTTSAPEIYLLLNDLTAIGDVPNNISSYDDLVNNAKEYLVEGISFDFDTSMGFFEYGGKLFFKKFDISIDLSNMNLGTPWYDGHKKTPEKPKINDNVPELVISTWRF
jgi:hypothetical protein|tara:strand:- start:441 stop:1859 length:1419 start_codon:yes stop_codon:yes gene_type:complete